MHIDLNCDVGEGFGIYRMAHEEMIIPHITSANIACGFHAGDAAQMRKVVRLCMEAGTAIGAHPGLPDKEGFGRRDMKISSQEAYDMVLYQIGALHAFVRAEGGTLHHVKPHGALYNMAARDVDLARAVTRAVMDFDPHLIVYGLSGSMLAKASEEMGVPFAHEVFADRTYKSDGSLTSRMRDDAVIKDTSTAVSQALTMIQSGTCKTIDGDDINVKADSICVHGDGMKAVEFVEALKVRFQSENIRVKKID